MVRVPHVSLDVRWRTFDSSVFPGLESLGLAALLTFAMAWLLGDWDFAPTDSLEVTRCALWGTAIAALVVFGIFDQRLHHLYRTLRPVWAGVALGILGSGLTPFVFVGGPLQALLLALLGCAMGLGFALVSLGWVIAYARRETSSILANAATGGVIGTVLFGVTTVLPDAAVYPALCLLPLIHLPLMRDRVTDRLPEVALRELTYFCELHVSRSRMALLLFPSFFVMGIVQGALAQNASIFFHETLALGETVTALVPSAVGYLLLAAAIIFTSNKDNAVNHIIRLLLGIVGLLALPLSHASVTQNPFLVTGWVLASFTLCLVLGWSLIANISQQYRLSPVFLGGVGLGSTIAGLLVSPMVTRWFAIIVDPALYVPNLLTDLILVELCLLLASALLPRQEDVVGLVVQSYDPAGLIDAAARAVGQSDDEAAGGRAEGDELAEGHGRAAAGWQTAPSESMAGARAGTAGAFADDGKLPAGKGGDVGSDPWLADHAEAQDSQDDSRPAQMGKFMRKCQRVADTFLLSRRETEVLFLLAKGRNVAYIMEHLVISEGTAKTHVHHIYRKTCVHSQQMLIELVDSMEDPEGEYRL